MTVVLVLALVIALGVALAFFLQYDALRKKDDERERLAAEASAEAQKTRKQLSEISAELTRRKEEGVELRKKLNEQRARSHKHREAERKQKGTAEIELADQLDLARRHLDEERGRADVLSRDAQGMQAELTRLRDAQRRLEATLQAVQAAASRPAPEVMAVKPAPKSDEQLLARAESLEAQLRDLRRKLALLEEEAKRAKSKASTSQRIQLLTRSELDLFREKLVWSEKRVVELERLLFENKVPLPERVPAPQPEPLQLAPGILARESANTGGEGVVAMTAEYEPPEEEESASDAEVSAEQAAEAQALPAENVDTEPVAHEPGRAAVKPLRRPKSEVDARTNDIAKAE